MECANSTSNTRTHSGAWAFSGSAMVNTVIKRNDAHSLTFSSDQNCCISGAAGTGKLGQIQYFTLLFQTMQSWLMPNPSYFNRYRGERPLLFGLGDRRDVCGEDWNLWNIPSDQSNLHFHARPPSRRGKGKAFSPKSKPNQSHIISISFPGWRNQETPHEWNVLLLLRDSSECTH